MENKPADSPAQSDLIILLVFLFIGGLLFAGFMMGSLFSPGGSVSAPTSRAAASFTPFRQRTVDVTITVTATPDGTGAITSVPGQVTPGRGPTSTPRPVFIYPTIPRVVYKSPTPIRIRTSTPTRTSTSTITSTITRTPTITMTVTQTPTESMTPTFTNSATPTATGTMTPTPTATPISLACLNVTPAGQPVLVDTYIDSGDPAAHGSQQDLLVSSNSFSNTQQRALFQFTLPAPASFSSATLYLYVPSQAQGRFSVHWLTRGFNDSANWEFAIRETPIQGWSSPGGDFLTPGYNFMLPADIPLTGCWVGLNVSNLVQLWIINQGSNPGIILLPGQEGQTVTIASKESTNGALLYVP